MKLYVTAGSGNSYKPVLALSQLHQNCKLIFVDVLAGETKSPKFLAINPAGAVPYLHTQSGAGLGESNAILWFLTQLTRLMPISPYFQAQALQWMFFEQTSLGPYISSARFFTTIAPSLGEEQRNNIPLWQEKARAGLAFLNNHLKGRDYIIDAGYCVADIALFGYTHLATEAGLTLADYPEIINWIARVEDTEGYQPLHALLPANVLASEETDG